MNPATVTIGREVRGAVVVTVSGEIDMLVHEMLLDQLQSAAKTAVVEAVGKVVVDLSRTSFLDSGGIRALVNGHDAAAALGVRFQLIGVTGLVETVLQVTGVLPMLTQEEAGSDTAALGINPAGR